MSNLFEDLAELRRMHSGLRNVYRKMMAEIEATEALGVNGYCLMLGEGTGRALAKTRDGKIGYFGDQYVRGTPLAMKMYADAWNEKYGGSEYEAHAAGPVESTKWFTESAQMVAQSLEKLQDRIEGKTTITGSNL